MLVALSCSVGCASTWETASSRRFRDKPFGTMFGREDPLHTLRTTPAENADERARAVCALKEPAKSGLGQEVQDEVLQMLSDAATQDSSPWMRVCAIDALTRFEDPRATEILANPSIARQRMLAIWSGAKPLVP